MCDLRDAAVQAIIDAAEIKPIITVLVSDSVSTSKIAPFSAKYPDKLLNVGISEQNLVSIAAGISLTGETVFTANAAPFLLNRANEQVKNDICYNNVNVKILGINAGFAYGPLGATHHAIDDVSIVKGMGNISILAPCDGIEAYHMTRWAINHQGPVYIRLDNCKVDDIHSSSYEHIGEPDVIQHGEHILVVSMGTIMTEVHPAVARAEKTRKHPIGLLNLSSIRPCDEKQLARLIAQYDSVVTIEEHSINGGAGSIISSIIARNGIPARVTMLAIADGAFAPAGPRDLIRAALGINSASITKVLEELP